MLEKFETDALLKVDVAISGNWRAGAIRDWQGQALASVPLVAVSFEIHGKQVSWCKSERGNPIGQSVRLLLGHYDSAGCDVAINFSIGGCGVRSRSMLASAKLYARFCDIPPTD